MDLKELLGRLAPVFANQLRESAKDAGKSCNLPECTSFTLGVRCEHCLRRLCVEHTYWKAAKAGKPVPNCPYCVLSTNPDLFFEDDDGPTRENTKTARDDGDVIDAEFE